MPAFPLLRTSAVTQYPAQRQLLFATQVLRFLDGSEQRIRQWPGSLRRWTIRLDLLSEDEMSRFRQFFRDLGGQAQSFRFVDPWDSVEYPVCTLDGDDLEIVLREEGRGALTLVVRESR